MIVRLNDSKRESSRRNIALTQSIEEDFWEEIRDFSYNSLRKKGIDYDIADDITQEVMLNLIERGSLKTYNSKKGKFTTWMRTISSNRHIDQLRKNKRHLETLSLNMEFGSGSLLKKIEDPYSNSPDQRILMEEENRQTQKLVDTIMKRAKTSPNYQALELYAFQGKGYKEIAEITRTPEGTVKSRISNARKELHEDINSDRIGPIRTPRYANRK